MTNQSVRQSCGGVDEVTRFKLDIYSEYLNVWLHVPLSGRMHVQEAAIHDLLCGSGTLAGRGEGGPIRTVDAIRTNKDAIRDHPEVAVRLVFNDRCRENVEVLRTKLGHHISTDDGTHLANIEYYAKPVADVLEELLPRLQVRETANLLFLDQFDTSELEDTRLRNLHALKKTDVLFFLAPNWFRRFAETEDADKWGVSKRDLDEVDYNHIHRFMAAYFRSLVGGDCFVAPFSLRSGADVHGLIFASHDPLGLEKFLRVAWKLDPYEGEANFDLYDEAMSAGQLALLDGRKVAYFQKTLMKSLEAGKFTSDRDIYLYILQRGFLARHAADTVAAFCRRLNVKFRSKSGRLGKPRLSNRSFRRPRPIVYC